MKKSQGTRIEHPCLILYRSATGLERALVDTGGGRLIDTPAERVRDMWDAENITSDNLPVLAWAMQAQLWDDDWPEATKRQWVARQWEYQALRGTRRGVEVALKVMGHDFTGGYDLIDVLTAPQGFFAVPSDWEPALLPVAGEVGYIGSFSDFDRVDYPPYNAELLIDLRTHEHGPAFFTDEGFVDEDFLIAENLADYDRALRALKGPGSATSLRDKIMVDFATTNPLRMGDLIFENPDTLFGERRPSWL